VEGREAEAVDDAGEQRSEIRVAHVSARARCDRRPVDDLENAQDSLPAAREKDRGDRVVVDELVLTDPKVYTTPIKITGTLRHRPDLQLLEYTCTDALWDEYLTERGLTLPDMDALPDPQP
jgi:hypothetical protein